MDKFEKFVIESNSIIYNYRHDLIKLGLIFDSENNQFYNAKHIRIDNLMLLMEGCRGREINFRIEYCDYITDPKTSEIYYFQKVDDFNYFIKYYPTNNIRYTINITEVEDGFEFNISDLKESTFVKDFVPIFDSDDFLFDFVRYCKKNELSLDPKLKKSNFIELLIAYNDL